MDAYWLVEFNFTGKLSFHETKQQIMWKLDSTFGYNQRGKVAS